jgi:signal transduction histidine kinase
MDKQSDHQVNNVNFLEKWFSLHWYHWLIVSLSLVLTFGAWYYSQSQVEKKIRLTFDREVSRSIDQVKERMQIYESGLFGGVAAIKMNGGSVNVEEWLKFSKSLDIDKKYPGISGVGVIHKVMPNQLDSYLAEQRKMRPSYKLHPQHNEDEYWPITYIEPFKSNKKAVGLDMAHEKNRFTAAKKAQDTGLAQITGPIILVQDSGKTAGFLFYAPYYSGDSYKSIEERQKHFKGIVYAPFIVKKLMEGTLQNTKRQVNISIADEGNTIFDEHSSAFDDFDPNPIFIEKLDLDFYGRVWQFEFRASKSFRESSSNNQSIFILIFGIFIDSLLFGLFVVLSTANKRAVTYANKVTIALQKSNEELEQFAYRTSHDLVSPLKSISGLLEFIEEDLDRNEISEVKSNLSRINSLAKKLTQLVGEILNLTKADNISGKNSLIDFDQLEMDIKERLEDLIKESGVVVKFENKLHNGVYCQHTRVIQIIENFVSNAIKYHDPTEITKVVTVSVELIRSRLSISVKDNGLGIPKEYQPEVFKMFKRFNPTVSFGSGLGLYLVKKHVEYLNGEISFDSSEKGTTFKVILDVEVSSEGN